jgi:crossover junction endodeoxyribonuclease RuvC
MGAMVQTVLGVDPGTQRAGWALVGRDSSGGAVHVASGTWVLGDSRRHVSDRLYRLRREMLELLQSFRPEMLALESAFFGKNARSALRLGEARGVVLVTAQEHGLSLLELPPSVVKRRIAGTGSASKEQVARLVSAQLELQEPITCTDQSDAVAVALCGLLDGPVVPTTGGSQTGLPKGASLQ